MKFAATKLRSSRWFTWHVVHTMFHTINATETIIALKNLLFRVAFKFDQCLTSMFLFSAHIPYGKVKYLNQTVLPCSQFISNLKSFTHKIQLT